MIGSNRRLNRQNRLCWGLWICIANAAIGGLWGQALDSELLRQQERERALREQLESAPQTRLPRRAHYAYVGGLSTHKLLGHHLAGAVLGLRGGLRGLNWDIFAGSPISKPSGFKTDSLTAGFQISGAY